MKKSLSFLSIPLITFVYFNILNVAIAEDLSRTHSSGGVEVTVILTDIEDLKSIREKKEINFEVYLNTHSVDLLAYQMNKISFIKDEEGDEYPAISWESLSESSHHRSGILKFSNSDEKGNFIINEGAKAVVLVIKGLAGIEERVFRWDIPE